MGEWRVRPPSAATLSYQTGFGWNDHSTNPMHRDRFADSAALVGRARDAGAATWVDYGCGGGGLLSMVDGFDRKWGVDFWESAAKVARARGLKVMIADAERFTTPADLASATEFLEHIDDPHGWLGRVPCRWLVASVPFHETATAYDPAHVWVWDTSGFRAMVEGAGFKVVEHTWRGVGQHILAERPAP